MRALRNTIWRLIWHLPPGLAMPALLWRARRFDPVFIGTYEALLPKRGVVIDVGAHRGLTAWIALRKGNRVIAFEPNPDNFRYLRRLGVDCRPLALSNREGFRQFRVPAGQDEAGSLLGTDGKAFEVRTGLLDREVDYADFLKIDVEGAERLVLDGARSTIGRFRPRLFVEVNADETGMDHLNAIISDLAALGYACRVLGPDGLFDFADFDLGRHQAEPRRLGDMRRYCNNFVFDAARRTGDDAVAAT